MNAKHSNAFCTMKVVSGIILSALFLFSVNIGFAQKPREKKAEPDNKPQDASAASGNEKRVSEMISFLQFMLNTLASKETPARDKDVLITESFSKIFRDAEVQIEDDLAEKRDVITNKNVVAYLKDVDFFFQDARFEFIINKVEESTLPGGDLFYKVSLTRTLTGTTSDGTKLSSTQPRFIEINLNPAEQDLKIVSMYTNVFNENEALTFWWNNLSYEWRSLFKKRYDFTDSIGLAEIRTMTRTTTLDLSDNKYILNLDPLSELQDLQTLNLSNTNIRDLSPLRNLTNLRELILNDSEVADLTPLRYATKLERLSIDHTSVSDISMLGRLINLKTFSLKRTPVYDFEPISFLENIESVDLQGTQISHLTPISNNLHLAELNITSTLVQDLKPVEKLRSLKRLYIDSTRINNLNSLSELDSLEMLSANFSNIETIDPLIKLRKIKRIYCDQTSVSQSAANKFLRQRPDVIVIVDSKDLQSWWTSVPSVWQQVLANTAKLDLAKPLSKEQLAVITNIDSINVSGIAEIKNLEPIRRMFKLRTLNANATSVSDLAPLENLRDLEVIQLQKTKITDLFVLRQNTNLKELYIDHTPVTTIDPLYGLKNLKKISADSTAIDDAAASDFLEKHPSCLIIYKSQRLNEWWSGLSEAWRTVFTLQMKTNSPNNESLHSLTQSERLQWRDIAVANLEPLSEFIRLSNLQFTGTAVRAIPYLENFKKLKTLHATNSPIVDINSIDQYDIHDLSLSNTAIEDLKKVTALSNLHTLNCSGTPIKKLDPLEKLLSLEHIDCSNTRIANLNPLMDLNLKSIKCYNTKITKNAMERFKERHPETSIVYY